MKDFFKLNFKTKGTEDVIFKISWYLAFYTGFIMTLSFRMPDKTYFRTDLKWFFIGESFV